MELSSQSQVEGEFVESSATRFVDSQLVRISPPSSTNTGSSLTSVYTQSKPLLKKTVSSDEFLSSATEIWNKFYGKTSKAIPATWYPSFACQFPFPNNTLTKCIQQLQLDQEHTQNFSNYRIIRFCDQDAHLIQKVITNLLLFGSKSPEYMVAGHGYSDLMNQNKSLIQRAIVNPEKKNSTNSTKSTPGPALWCPEYSIFPFHGFQGHVNWVLAKSNPNHAQTWNDEVLRLRYVEYLNLHFHQNSYQLLLGILIAYGPNVHEFPMRILGILKIRELLRPGTLLYDKTLQMINETEPYSKILSQPNHAASGISAAVNEHELEDLIRRTRRILNKLTPGNFNELMQEFLSLKFDTKDERIDTIVSVIFEKAIRERSFAPLYARMVCYVCNMESSQLTSKVFLNKIINQCQKEFERGNVDDEAIKLLESKLAGAIGDKVRIMAEIEKTKLDGKNRSLGNIQFIAELYNLNLLTARVIVECITKLVCSSDENSLDCLFVLLKTIGHKLELQLVLQNATLGARWVPEPDFMNKTFMQLHQLSKDMKLPPRIRYALLDLCELRNSTWVLQPAIILQDIPLDYPVEVKKLVNSEMLTVDSLMSKDLVKNVKKRRWRSLKHAAEFFISEAEYENMKSVATAEFSGSEASVVSVVANPMEPLVSRVSVVAAAPSVDLSVTTNSLKNLSDSMGDKQKIEPTNYVSWKQAYDTLVKDYDSSDFEIPENFYRDVFSDYEKLRTGINSPNDQAVFHLFFHGALAGIQLKELSNSSSFNLKNSRLIKSAFDKTLPFKQSDSDFISEDAQNLITQFLPDTKILPLLLTFTKTKKIESEIIEEIQENFTGDKVQEFVQGLSYHVCFTTNHAEIRLYTRLIRVLIGKDILSTSHLIHSFKIGIIRKLPEVFVKVVEANFRLAEFLVEVFLKENDFCWFLILTESLSQNFFPVWLDLFKTTVNILQRRTSRGYINRLLSRTPGTEEFAKYLPGISSEISQPNMK